MGYQVRILQSNALQIGNIAIAWDPAAGPPIVHGIHVLRDGQTIDVMKAASFEVLRREDKLEEAMLDGTLTAVLRVPDLRVGDELDVEWTSFSKDPTMGGKASGLLVLAASPAPGRYHLGLNWDAGHKPQLKVSRTWCLRSSPSPMAWLSTSTIPRRSPRPGRAAALPVAADRRI